MRNPLKKHLPTGCALPRVPMLCEIVNLESPATGPQRQQPLPGNVARGRCYGTMTRSAPGAAEISAGVSHRYSPSAKIASGASLSRKS